MDPEQKIWTEVDTQDRLIRLKAQVEECIHFLVNVGGERAEGIDGETFLDDFVLQNLQVAPAEWSAISSEVLRRQVHLKHLRSLFTYISDQKNGDGKSALDAVALKYSDGLSEQQITNLQRAASKMELSVLCGQMRNWLESQLTDPKWPADANLKEWFGYALEDDYEWYEDHFPEELALCHALEAYKLLQALERGT